ncbi:hypothetical protein [Sinorhizobium meliloti]|uniref:hypothetical protein n=1 Tax=Rhizobium meliloti TaxID=382 RepID=UPI003DA11B34
MTFLLDVNVLISLIDRGHVAHDGAHEWFAAMGHAAWASCPITENAVIHIVGNPKYPNSPGSPSLAMEIVRKLRSRPGHCFWPNNVFSSSRHKGQFCLAPDHHKNIVSPRRYTMRSFEHRTRTSPGGRVPNAFKRPLLSTGCTALRNARRKRLTP